jgi:hypothetical protein
MCVRSNDQWYEAPCISNSWGKFQIMFIMFAEPPLGGGLREAAAPAEQGTTSPRIRSSELI